jgi:hypothetical protein
VTADDDDIDDASLKSMRAVWLSMRDEEPPAAGMSGLLAAARDKADAMRAQPTWWQRLFTQLRRPPALAFATVLLLVGGAALVTRNVDNKVESETAAVAPADELRVREVTPDREEVQQPPPEAVVAQPVVPEKVEPKPRPKKDVVAGGKRTQPRAGAKLDDDVGPNEPTRDDRFEADAAPTFAEGKDPSPVLESPGRVDRQDPPKAQKSAGEQVTITGQATTTPPNEQLARQAESAATRGDCPAVKAIVGKLKQQDERFYKARLGKNAAVTKCL